jgi:archaetidylinositol phosphate synthase
MTTNAGAAPPPQPSAFKNAARIQQSFSAGAERRALLWLAERMPPWVNSDHLTILGFVSMFLVGASYAFARWNRAGLMLATFFLALNWFGDSLDGTIARVRNCQRPRYGFYVDHIVDSFGALFLMGGLAMSGYADWRIAAGMLVAFLMLSIEVYLAVYTMGAFHMSFWKFGPTELRILLAMANTALWFRGNFRVFGTRHGLFDVGGSVGIAGMGVMLILTTISHIRTLYREETRPCT